MLLKDYPGLTRGLARCARIEELLRTSATTTLYERINGLEVRQLTARHLDLLILASSPFLIKPVTRLAHFIVPKPEDATLFLWIVSPGNPLNGSLPPDDFFHSLRPHDPDYFRRFYRAIDSYYQRATIDQPHPSSDSRQMPTAVSVGMVHHLAGAYGWPAEVFNADGCPIQLGQPGRLGIKDMPIALLNQQLVWIRNDRDPAIPLRSELCARKRVRIVNFWDARAKALGVTKEEAIAAWKEGREVNRIPETGERKDLISRLRGIFKRAENEDSPAP